MRLFNKPKKDDHIVDKLIERINEMSFANADMSIPTIAFYIGNLLVSVTDGIYINVEVNYEKLSVSRRKRKEFISAAIEKYKEQQSEKQVKRRKQINNTLNIL